MGRNKVEASRNVIFMKLLWTLELRITNKRTFLFFLFLLVLFKLPVFLLLSFFLPLSSFQIMLLVLGKLYISVSGVKGLIFIPDQLNYYDFLSPPTNGTAAPKSNIELSAMNHNLL